MMEKNYEVSPNLIEQVQILLKKEAGVESLNSNDHSLDNSLQSSYLNEAIVGLNSSADALRCKLCEGELFRGSESIICVYCGHAQNQDFVRRPISFKSTIAFQWLLQSLGLDGFENVGNQIEGNQSSDRGQKSFEEISLSDLLDLQLKWAYDDDSRGFGVQNEEHLGKRYLSLVGIDVEEILAQEIRDRGASSVTIEQPVVREKAENEFTKISGEGSLSLFENMQSSEAASISVDTQKNESYPNWGADFHSGFPGLGHEKSANLLISDTPSSANVSTSRIEFGSNLEIAAAFNSKVSNENILVGGAGKVVEPNASFAGLPVNQNEHICDDDSFDEWGDFSMSTSDKITQSESSSTAVIGTDNSGGPVLSDPFNDFIGSAVSKDAQIQNNTLRVPDDAWNTFITPSTGGNIQSQSMSGKPEKHGGRDNTALGGANDLDLLSVVQLQGGESKSIAPGTVNELDDSFDLGNDSMGSDNQQQATKREVAHNGISADAWNEFSVLGFGEKEEQANSLELFGGKGTGAQNDSLAFDSWNEFTRSGIISDSKPTSNEISSGAWNDFSSLMVTHANQTQSSNIRTSGHEAILDDDNLLSSWSDFRSSGAQVNNIVGPNDTKTNSDPFDFHKDPNSSRIIEDNFTLSSSLDSGGKTIMLQKQLHLAGAESYEGKLSSAGGDLFSALGNSNQSTNPQNPLQCDAVTVLDGKSTCEIDDSFDAWSDFTSSSDVKANCASSENVPDNKEAVKHDDIFDAWSVKVSSDNMEVGKDTAFAMGKSPELNSFSPNINSQYVGPESLMQRDVSVGMFKNQNGSAPVPFSPSEGPDMVRTKDGDVKADGSVDRMNPGSKETVAEALISEMHDLSFMLESGLSIPEK